MKVKITAISKKDAFYGVRIHLIGVIGNASNIEDGIVKGYEAGSFSPDERIITDTLDSDVGDLFFAAFKFEEVSPTHNS